MKNEDKLLRSYHFYMNEQSLELASVIMSDEKIEHTKLNEADGYLCFVPQTYKIQALVKRLMDAGVELEAFHPYRF